jgi:hypothetical protein
VDTRAGLEDVEKRKFLTLQGLELRPLGRPARSQLLYRLRYPGYPTHTHTHTHTHIYIYICTAFYTNNTSPPKEARAAL